MFLLSLIFRSFAGNPQRPPSYLKRHASFESPREVPLPSPSLSLFSPGFGSPSSNSLFSNIPSEATPSANPTSQFSSSSSRLQEVTDYFPTLLSQAETDSPSSPSGSSSQSSQQSNRASFQNSCTFSSGHYPVFEDEEFQGHDYDRGHSNLSDWTSQTSPSPPLVMCGTTQVQKQHPDQQSATSVASSDLKHQYLSPFENTDATSALGSSTMTPSQRPSNTLEGSHTHATMKDPGTGTRVTAMPIFPFSRPYSLPDGHSQPSKSYNTTHKTVQASEMGTDNIVSDSTQLGVGTLATSTPPPLTWQDRSSSASLPLPSQIPFHTLPKVERAIAGGVGFPDLADGVETSGYVSDLSEAEDADESSRPEPHHQHHRQSNYPHKHNHAHSSTSSTGSTNLHSAESAEKSEERVPPSASSSFPRHGAGDTFAGHPAQSQVSPRAQQCSHTQSPSQAQSPSQLHPQQPLPAPQQRSISPFRAPQPRPEAASQPSGTASAAYSAMASYPAPDPPTILGPTNDAPNRAYEPFLSHAPPPADSWIEVETTAGEYRLNVRLPGFRRDAITLATKKRRILHVVADCWENGGGGFFLFV